MEGAWQNKMIHNPTHFPRIYNININEIKINNTRHTNKKKQKS